MHILQDKEPFPGTIFANVYGIVAIGGEISVDRLLEAYGKGIFPWYSEDSSILWWSPDPRFVLFTNNLHVSKSMKKVLKSGVFSVTYDTCFEEVIRYCKTHNRKGQDGTWITDEMEMGYIDLHREGFAHSVEVWRDDKLVGGLYGVSLGRVFFGESMFALESNASKFGFITLVNRLKEKGFELIDCQDYTEHLASLGAQSIPRRNFEKILQKELSHSSQQGSWTNWLK